MIRFFGNQDKDEIDTADSRLRSVEWKLNLLLLLVGAQLLITVATLAKDMFMPSTFTIVIVSALLIAVVWFFRKQIPGLIKRMVVRQVFQEERAEKGPASRSETEESIR